MNKRKDEVNNEQMRKETKQIDRCSIPNKKKRIEQFTKKLVEDFCFDNCGCNRCHDWYKTLYDLSSKIYLSYNMNFSDIESKENVKLNIAMCLNSPSHLMYLFGKETDSGLVIDFSDSDTNFLIEMIGISYNFMNLKEKEYFGENVLAIRGLLNCPECKKEDEKMEQQKELELSL